MQFLSVVHIFVSGVFLVLGLILVAAAQGFRCPERCSGATWILFAGIASAEAALLFSLQGESGYRTVVVFSALTIVAFLLAVVVRDFSSAPAERMQIARNTRQIVVLSLLCIGIGVYFAATLDSCPQNLLTWEGQVSRGFAESLNSGESLVHFILQRFLWDEGLVSSGEKSFLYGVTSRIIFSLSLFSVWTLRAAALLFAVLSLPLFYIMARRFFGRQVAFIGTLVFFLNPLVLSYARYGTSLSATIFALILALYFTFMFMSQHEPKWWLGLLTGCSYFLVTLHYSPARLCVLLFAGFLIMHTVLLRRERTAAKFSAIGVLMVFGLLVFALQYWTGANRVFLNARGEQVFKLIEAPDWVHDQIGVRKSYDDLLRADKIRLVKKLINTNVRQFAEIVSPVRGVRDPWEGISSVGDPPELSLYFGPLMPFFLWGFLAHLFRMRDAKGYLMLFWIFSVSGVLLLTNRVDLHRAYILVIPFSLFSAWGLSDFLNEYANLFRSRLPLTMAGILAIGCLLAQSLFTLRPDESGRVPESIEQLRKAVEIDPRLVKVAFSGDHRFRSWINMGLVEKNRIQGSAENESLDSAPVEKLSDEAWSDSFAESKLSELREAKYNSVLYLAPRLAFKKLIEILKKRECELETREFPDFEVVVMVRCPPAVE